MRGFKFSLIKLVVFVYIFVRVTFSVTDFAEMTEEQYDQNVQNAQHKNSEIIWISKSASVMNSA